MSAWTVLVVDANRELQAGLRALLHSADIAVDVCATGEEALATIAASLPAAVIADLSLSDGSGLELCRTIRERHGEDIGIILMSAQRTTAADRTLGLLLGADDYLAKPFDWGELLARLQRLLVRCSDVVAPSASTDGAAGRLTQREREVLQLLAEGRSQDQICASLVIAPKTASAHIQRILLKIGAHSRAQAVAIAYRDGLVTDRPCATERSATVPPTTHTGGSLSQGLRGRFVAPTRRT